MISMIMTMLKNASNNHDNYYDFDDYDDKKNNVAEHTQMSKLAQVIQGGIGEQKRDKVQALSPNPVEFSRDFGFSTSQRGLHDQDDTGQRTHSS